MKLYVASSWRNLLQPGIVTILRKCGHEVYDFRNPRPGQHGFSWRDIDPDWQQWTPEQYREAMKHPIAAAGYALDIGALTACDACVLVLPAGRPRGHPYDAGNTYVHDGRRFCRRCNVIACARRDGREAVAS